MRVAFVLPDLSRSGGVGVVLEHARRLEADHGFDMELVTPAEARGRRCDVAIATWWTTAEALYALDATHRAIFLQSLEYQWYRPDEAADMLPASLTLSLPVTYLAVSEGLRTALERLRPDAACQVVPNGVDKDVFTPASEPRRHEGALRVLVEGQPTIWLKGVQDAVRAVRAMSEPVHLTVAALEPDGTEDLGADTVRTGLSPGEMADLYRDSDVLLKLSRVDGLGLPAIEAMHCGVPCIVTPFTGQSDYVRHGDNGLVVEFDDQPGTTAWLDTLARDHALRERLAAGALDTAAGWPSPADSSARLAEALRQIASTPPPAPEPAMADVLARVGVATELARIRDGELRWHEEALATARRHVREVDLNRDREHAALNGSPLYRVLRMARRTARRDPPLP